jgi:oligoribonuclease NrnB/cAMP/cGMP phosphodiesterase (DHH superfamily)
MNFEVSWNYPSDQNNLVVLYHGNCPDGSTAAWVLQLEYPNATYIPVSHGEQPPFDKIYGKDVLLVDFCYPREVLLQVKEASNRTYVLDHHITAQKECSDLDFCYFDMSKSGAGLAWQFLYDNAPPPKLVEYIQYRDLGFIWSQPREKWPHQELDAIFACIDSYERTPTNLNTLAQLLTDNPNQVVLEGRAILRYKEDLIKTIIKHAHEVNINGQKALCVNSPVLQSDIGNILARSSGIDFGMVWYQGQDNTRFSLRSLDSKDDVSKIAQSFGGGGHRNAAGFGGRFISIDSLCEVKNGKR